MRFGVRNKREDSEERIKLGNEEKESKIERKREGTYQEVGEYGV